MTIPPFLPRTSLALLLFLLLLPIVYAEADPSILTALHPGGVQPQVEHTELEHELHEKAHIDYDRVAIVRCHQIPSPDILRANLPPSPGPQSFSCSPIRRRPCLRDWLCYHIYWCSHRILGGKDWSFTLGQEDC